VNSMGNTSRFLMAVAMVAVVDAVARIAISAYQLAISANRSADDWLGLPVSSGADPVGQMPLIALAGLVGWVLPRWIWKPLRNKSGLAAHIVHGVIAFVTFDTIIFALIQIVADFEREGVLWQLQSFVIAQAILSGAVWGMTYWSTHSAPSYVRGDRS